MALDLRLKAYTANGAALGYLPSPVSVNVSYPLSDVGALTMDYAAAGPRSDLLGSPIEIAVEVTYDGGTTWAEPPSSRFLYLQDGRDPVKGDAYSITAPSWVWRLGKIKVLPEGALDANGKRTFTGAKAGAILHQLLTEANLRGAMTGMTWDFTAVNDSNGVAWTQNLTLSYDPGQDYLSILLDLNAQGVLDFRTSARVIQVYRVDSSVTAGDVTTGANPVSLRFGRDITEAPFRRTWEAVAGFVYVAGDGGASVQRTNGAAVQPWGRWETYQTQGGVSDSGTLTALADAYLALTADKRVEYTRGLDFTTATFLPFRDYQVGQSVWDVTDGTIAPVKYRTRQITLQRNSDGTVAGNVVLNDRFTELDVLTARRISSISGASDSEGGTGGTPTGVGNDILAPGTVGTITPSSTAYLNTEGQPRAQVTLNWPDLTLNADASVMSDLDHYEVWRKLSTDTVWNLVEEVAGADSFWTDSPYDVGSVWTFKVRAVDSVFNRGAFSPVATQTMANDTTPPGTPATPTITSRLGVLLVKWSGLLSGGGAQPADYLLTEVHVSTTTGFTPSAATLVDVVNGAATVPLTDLPYGVVHYAKVISQDRSGNRSAASAQASGTVTALVNTDLIGQIIANANIIDGTIVASAKIVAGSITAASALIANAAIGDAQINSLAVDKITAGTLSVAVTISGSIKTASSGARVQLTSAGIKSFDAAGLQTSFLDAATGKVTLTAMTISGASDIGVSSTTDPLASIGVDGKAAFQSVATTSISLAGDDLATTLLNLPRGIIAYSEKTFAINRVATGGGEDPLYEISAMMEIGRIYRFSISPVLAESNPGSETGGFKVYYTQDGTRPTIASPVYGQLAAVLDQQLSTSNTSLHFSKVQKGESTAKHRFLISLNHTSPGAADLVRILSGKTIRVSIEDLGPNVPDTGIAPGAVEALTETLTWPFDWAGIYKNVAAGPKAVDYGNSVAMGAYSDTAFAYAAVNSFLGFAAATMTDILAKTAGATINKVTLGLWALETSGGSSKYLAELELSSHVLSNTTAPATNPLVGTYPGGLGSYTEAFALGIQTNLVLANSVGNNFKSGAQKGFRIGPSSGVLVVDRFYGPGHPTKFPFLKINLTHY